MRPLLVFLLIVGGSVFAQQRPQPPDGPPQAEITLCGNRFFREKEKAVAAAEFIRAGCDHIHFIRYADDWWLGYGTRIIEFE